MKKVFISLALAAASFAAVSCYNDKPLWDEINSLKSRMTSIERAYGELVDYKTIMANMQAVQSVTLNADGSYTISFYGDVPAITISNGKKGDPGESGTPGATPSFKIEDDIWYVSYDNGESWSAVGEATSSLFSNAYLDGEDFFVLVLLDGTEVKIPLKAASGGEEGGEDPEPEPSMYEAWLGNWKLGTFNAVIAEDVKDQSVTLSIDYLELNLDYNEDGTLSFKYPAYNGWVGTDSSNNYYYLYAYKGSTYVSKSQGDLISTWTMSEDKTSATVSGDGSYDYLYVGSYASDNSTWRGYVSVIGGGNLYQNLTKAEEGGGESPAEGLADTFTLNKRSDWKFSFYSGWARVTAMTTDSPYCFMIIPNSDALTTDDGVIAAMTAYQIALRANGTADEVIDGYFNSGSPLYKMFSTQASNNYGYIGYESGFWNGEKSSTNRYAGILMGVNASTLDLTGDYYIDWFNDTEGQLN
ncbi:MAG: hypothetical protein IJ623_03550 [Bacteroidales bacterium]|nr:hypothetical protein [Bacteroidales bacterium]